MRYYELMTSKPGIRGFGRTQSYVQRDYFFYIESESEIKFEGEFPETISGKSALKEITEEEYNEKIGKAERKPCVPCCMVGDRRQEE